MRYPIEEEPQDITRALRADGEDDGSDCEDPPPKHGRGLDLEEPESETQASDPEDEPSESGSSPPKIGRGADPTARSSSESSDDEQSESGDPGTKTGRGL